jgi:hypothetical protein
MGPTGQRQPYQEEVKAWIDYMELNYDMIHLL